MPKYFYKAKNLKAEEKVGAMEAPSVSELAKALKDKGYFLISSDEEKKGVKNKINLEKLKSLERFFGIPLKEKLFFTKNMEVMIRTGVPLPRAFSILANQAKNTKFKKALLEISSKIMKGDSLSDALAFFPDIFSVLYRETLKVGEETGKIEESLGILAQQMEREHELKSSIKTAMVYPVIVLILAVFIGIAMFIFAIPKLKQAFTELEVELPITTKMLISLSDFMVNQWPIFLLLVCIIVVLIATLIKKKKSNKITGLIILRIPLVSKIIKQINSAITLRTLSSLMSAGVPIVRALNVASGSLNNYFFKQSLLKASKIVEKGQKLSQALEPYKHLYSPMVIEMMKVGEETGETSEVLEKLASFYEKEVTAATEKISSVIEPFLIIVIGGIVGFFALSMMQPMFSLMQGF